MIAKTNLNTKSEVLGGHAGRVLTRFAPSPTGRLHLGHVLSALYVWAGARAFDGLVLLRIEDHDRERSRPEFEQGILDDLSWLGLVPDLGLEHGAVLREFRQSDCLERYEADLQLLIDAGLAYACECSRAQIKAQHPQSGDELFYPGTCRDKKIQHGVKKSQHGVRCGWRMRLPADSVVFDDLLLGAQLQQPSEQCGDFLLRERNGNFSYQFAVVSDDLQHGVDLIVRGQDLTASTGRQLLLRDALAKLKGIHLKPLMFCHHPLLLDQHGAKFSKSAGSQSIDSLRASGVSAEAVIAEALKAVFPSGQVRDLAGLIDYLRNWCHTP
jgi:glutamyl-Q tRNA(Asp) synthetase